MRQDLVLLVGCLEFLSVFLKEDTRAWQSTGNVLRDAQDAKVEQVHQNLHGRRMKLHRGMNLPENAVKGPRPVVKPDLCESTSVVNPPVLNCTICRHDSSDTVNLHTVPRLRRFGQTSLQVRGAQRHQFCLILDLDGEATLRFGHVEPYNAIPSVQVLTVHEAHKCDLLASAVQTRRVIFFSDGVDVVSARIPHTEGIESVCVWLGLDPGG